MERFQPSPSAGPQHLAHSYRELASQCREMATHCRKPGSLLLRAAAFEEHAQSLEPPDRAAPLRPLPSL